jgi:hypothetical protein
VSAGIRQGRCGSRAKQRSMLGSPGPFAAARGRAADP